MKTGLLAVALLLSCRPSIDPAAGRAALMDADRAFAAATAQDRVEGWVRYFAPDGSMFRPGGLATGPAAVRERMTPAFADTSFTLSWEPTQAQIAASGDLGYTIGRYQSRRRGPTGEVRTATGSYLTVWRKQPDGTWKVVADIGTPDAQ